MKDFLLIMPEVILVLTLAFVVICEITYSGEQLRLVTLISLLGLAGVFFQALISFEVGAAQIFSGTLSIDGFSLFFKFFFIVLAFLSVVSVSHSREMGAGRRTEYCLLILASTLSMFLAASASDVILAYLSLLFLNILSYFMTAYRQKSLISTEASVKYLTFGVVSGALYIYAVAILFVHTHTLNIYQMHKALVSHPMNSQTMLIAFMLIFLSFTFQIGAFPMNLIVPDIIEGAPTPSSAFLSVGARAAGFALITRFLIVIFAQNGLAQGQWEFIGDLDWTKIVAVVAGFTMVIGSLLAFRQKGAKRLVGNLVVSESGFLLLGIVVLDEVGITALLYNLVIQLFALMGVFYVLSFIYNELQSDLLEDLKGMLRRAVPETVCLILFLLCLVGCPPTPGFVGKFALIGAAIRHGKYSLAMVSVLAMSISMFAIARLAYRLVGDFRQVYPPFSHSWARKSFILALLLPLVLIGVFSNFVFAWAGQSLGFIFW